MQNADNILINTYKASINQYNPSIKYRYYRCDEGHSKSFVIGVNFDVSLILRHPIDRDHVMSGNLC